MRKKSTVSGSLGQLLSRFSLAFLLLTAHASLAPAQVSFKVTTLVEDLDQPWGLAFLPTGEMLITEKSGQLRLVKDGSLDPRPLQGLPDVYVLGQGGLLDIILHPDYSENNLIYISYSAGNPMAIGTEVARARLNLKEHRLDDVQVVFTMQPKLYSPYHFGSRLLFDDAGYLYITLGERGRKEGSQDLTNHQGAVIRLHDDGAIPQDNPFVHGQKGEKPAIYSYGHRNVQGIALHPKTRAIWTHEHGPRGGDEVNILKRGANYGWPIITYGIDYDGSVISNETRKEGMEQPVLHWTPSIAPCGMMFYTGNQFPEWKGSLFVGALAKRHLRRIEFDADGQVLQQELLLEELRERIRDVRQGPDGLIYILTDSRNGQLLRLENN